MGFLERLKQSQEASIDDWKVINAESHLNEIDDLSRERPIAIFKHSTSCGISAGAKHRLESEWYKIVEDLDLYYLDLLSYRAVSNAIADRYGIRHESPQIIVLRDGKPVYHTSHHRINVDDLKRALEG